MLARADADARELGADLHFRGRRGCKLQREVEVLEQPGLHELLVDLRKVHCGSRGRRRLLQVGRQGSRKCRAVKLPSTPCAPSSRSSAWCRTTPGRSGCLLTSTTSCCATSAPIAGSQACSAGSPRQAKCARP